MAASISSGAVSRMLSDAPSEGHEPTVQIIKITEVKGGRYGLTISDGDNFTNAVAAAQCNDLFAKAEIEVNAVVKVLRYTLIQSGDKKMLQVFSLETVESGAAVGMKVGEPREAGKAVQVSQTPNKTTAPLVGDTPTSTTPTAKQTVTPATKAAKTPTKGAVVRSDESIRTMPISQLNPYCNAWTIKGRLVAKGDIKTWSNARGDGKLFKMTFMDAEGGEIEAVAFKDECDKFYESTKEGTVYFITGGRIKVANMQYSGTKCGYEITLGRDSRIEQARDQDGGIAAACYDFVKIAELEGTDEGSIIDLVGVVKSAEDASEITSQKLGGRTLMKRDLTLVDETGAEVRLTVWGEKAKANTDWSLQPVIVLKGVKVSEYNGRQLGCLQSTRMSIDPFEECPEAAALKEWWTSGGSETATKALSRSGGGGGGVVFEPCATLAGRSSLGAMKENPRLGQGSQPDYFEIKACMSYAKTDRMWYESCPHCQKKVTESHDGGWSCEKCQKPIENCERRYVATLKLVDAEADSWFSCFNEIGVELFGGKNADYLASMSEEGQGKLEDYVKSFYFMPMHLKVKVKTETYNDQARLKAQIVKMVPVDYAKESKRIIEALRA